MDSLLLINARLSLLAALSKQEVDRGKRSLLAKEASALETRLIVRSKGTYTSLATLSSRAGDVQRAMGIPLEMKDCGLTPTLGIYSALIRGLTLSRKPREALKVYEIMKADRITPDLHLLASLILAQPDIDHVDNFLRQVRGEFGDFQPDIVLYNAMVKVASLSDDLSRCNALMSEMQIQGISPDVYTYQSLLHCLARRGELEQCRWIVRKHVPIVVAETVSSLVHASINGKHKPDSILVTLAEFSHIRPNDQLIAALYQAASRVATNTDRMAAERLVRQAEGMISR